MSRCTQCQHHMGEHDPGVGCLYGWDTSTWYLFETVNRRGRPEPCPCPVTLDLEEARTPGSSS